MLQKSRFVSLLVSAAMVFTMLSLGIPAAQASPVTLDISAGDIIIAASGSYIITQSSSVAETVYGITVADSVYADITLSGVNIDITAKSPFAINANAQVNLTLEAGTDNTLCSDDGSDVVQANGFAALQMAANSELVIDGGGILRATGGDHCAGIGGGQGGDGGTVTINEGTVYANGGYAGAGIGGGEGGDGGTITINGGTVEAVGGDPGAGIGGGGKGFSGSGSGGAAGIITITNGNVTAIGGNYGAGIGGGYGNNGGTIEISGGEITATGGSMGAGIGGGGTYGGENLVDISGGNITISGGTVTASGGANSAGIGGGGDSDASLTGGPGGRITISGGTVTATGGKWAAGIGGGRSNSGGEITISGGAVTALGGTVGVGYDGINYYIIGGGGAGIGGGGTTTAAASGGSGGEIAISGGTVTATGGYYAAGIGGGRLAPGGEITLSGGTVTATGGTVGFAYGGGRNTGGGGAGIGGGGAFRPEQVGGNGAVVTVANNPGITATGKDGGEHIGKGYNGANSGRLQDHTASELSYLHFQVTDQGNSAVSGATVTVNNHTHTTNSDGLVGCVVPRGSEATFSVMAAGYNAESGSITPVSISAGVLVSLSRSSGGGGSSSAISVGNVPVSYSRSGPNVNLDIDQDRLERMFENCVSQVRFNLSSISGVTGATVPAAAWAALAENGKGTEFVMPDGTININPGALAAIAGQAAGDTVTVSLGILAQSELTPEQQAAVGGNTVYDISILSGGQNISGLEGGVITLNLPYTLKEGEAAEGVSIWYLDDAGNLLSIPCTYDPATGTVSCNLTHLSYYVVGYAAPPVQPVWVNPFTDVGESDWFYESVAFVVQKGLFSGTSHSTFGPEGDMTRAMLVTVLYRLAGEPGGGTNSFSDVPDRSWYADAVAWASGQGIVKGCGSGEFRPADPITREQLAVILYNYARSRGYSVSGFSDAPQFADGSKVSAWAAEAMKWAAGTGLITGKGSGILDPQGTAARAQVAAVLQRFVEKNM